MINIYHGRNFSLSTYLGSFRSWKLSMRNAFPQNQNGRRTRSHETYERMGWRGSTPRRLEYSKILSFPPPRTILQSSFHVLRRYCARINSRTQDILLILVLPLPPLVVISLFIISIIIIIIICLLLILSVS